MFEDWWQEYTLNKIPASDEEELAEAADSAQAAVKYIKHKLGEIGK